MMALASSDGIKADEDRLTKLRGLFDKLKRGETVQNRQLRLWLGERGYKVYEGEWANSVEVRKSLSTKPSELVEYEELLKKATLLYHRGERASISGQFSVSRPLHEKAQVAFERALLRLEELMSQNPSLQMWLDRHCDFTANGTLHLDPISVPRTITSRSADRVGIGIGAFALSKRQCKIRAIEDEIGRIENPTEDLSGESISEKLQKLQKLKSGWKKVGIS